MILPSSREPLLLYKDIAKRFSDLLLIVLDVIGSDVLHLMLDVFNIGIFLLQISHNEPPEPSRKAV